jgi:hypothetical protein
MRLNVFQYAQEPRVADVEALAQRHPLRAAADPHLRLQEQSLTAAESSCP